MLTSTSFYLIGVTLAVATITFSTNVLPYLQPENTVGILVVMWTTILGGVFSAICVNISCIKYLNNSLGEKNVPR